MANDTHHFADVSHGFHQILNNRVLLIHDTYLHIHRLWVRFAAAWTDLFFLRSSPESKLAQNTDHFAVVSHRLYQILSEIHFLHNYSSILSKCAPDCAVSTAGWAVFYFCACRAQRQSISNQRWISPLRCGYYSTWECVPVVLKLTWI